MCPVTITSPCGHVPRLPASTGRRTPAGYAARAHLIARALARAFPRSGPSTTCIIR